MGEDEGEGEGADGLSGFTHNPEDSRVRFRNKVRVRLKVRVSVSISPNPGRAWAWRKAEKLLRVAERVECLPTTMGISCMG